MKIAMTGALLLLVFCVVSVPAYGQGEFKLKYQEFKDESHSLVNFGRQWVQRAREKPTELKGLPDGLGSKAGYFVGHPDGTKTLQLFMAVDPGNPAKLYIDTDLDSDLSDEKALTATVRGTTARFGVVSVKSADAKDAPAMRFAVYAHQRGTVHGATITGLVVQPRDDVQSDAPFIYLYLSPAGFFSGEATFGEDTYAIVLMDGGLDGRFGKTPGAGARGGNDFLAMDLNGDGRFDQPAGELMPLGGMVRVGNSYFSVEVEADGSAVRFEDAKPKLGTLDAESPDVRLSVSSSNGFFRLEGSDGSWQLPVGRYSIAMLQLGSKDEEGVEWTLQCLRPPEKLRQFEIREGETTSLEIGPPLTLATTTSKKGKTVSIGLELTGRAGEPYLPGVEKNGKRQDAPTLKILDENDKELASGSFRYG